MNLCSPAHRGVWWMEPELGRNWNQFEPLGCGLRPVLIREEVKRPMTTPVWNRFDQSPPSLPSGTPMCWAKGPWTHPTAQLRASWTRSSLWSVTLQKAGTDQRCSDVISVSLEIKVEHIHASSSRNSFNSDILYDYTSIIIFLSQRGIICFIYASLAL